LASAGRDAIEPLQPGPEILAEQFAEIEVAPPVPIDPQVAPAPANVASAETPPAEIEAAPATSPAAPTPAGQDIDDLVFRPHAYAGRQVELTGSVVYLMWDYRLKSETGQNSLVVNIDGLSPANRTKLASAVERAGFLGQVRARITGTVRRQTPATFELAASELTLIERAPEAGEVPDPSPTPDETASPVAASGPVVLPAPAKGSGSRTSSGLGRQAGLSAPSYVPTCYQDQVWRRLPDGRIQTGTRTRCY
jgi:hypothetical protein